MPVPRLRWPATLAVTAVALIALELVCRLWVISPSASRTATPAGWIDEPGQRMVFSREGYSITHINSFGYHDLEPKETYTWRVLLVGDSYGEAFHVPRRKAFAQVAEDCLPGLDVINTSRSALTVLDYALYFSEHVRNWNPDAAVVVLNDGDIDDLQGMNLPDNPDSALAVFGRRSREALQGWTGWKHTVDLAIQRSALLTFMYHRARLLIGKERRRLQGKFSKAPGPAPELQGESVPPRIMDLYLAVHRRLSRAGVPLVYLYIPHLDYTSRGITPGWPRRRAFFLEFSRRTGAPLIDLTQPFLEAVAEADEPVHGFQNSVVGSGHINRLGHDVAGRRLAATLEELLR